MFYSKITLSIFAMVALTAATPTPINKIASPVDKRLEPCETSRIQRTIVVGDGSPHQNFVYKQVSGNTDCDGNPSGSAAVTETKTVSYSLSLGATLDFITAGFDVSESTSTGFTNAFGCGTNVNGVSGSQSGSLCVFERIQLTAYTVNTETCTLDTCGDETCVNNTGPDSVIYAPNSVQGSCFYDNFQVNLPCGVLGDEHYVYNGPSGGPQFIACQPIV